MALLPRRTPRAMAGVRATGLRELYSATHGDVGIISLEFLGGDRPRYNTKAYVLAKEQKGPQKEEVKSVFYKRQYLADVLQLAGANTEDGFLVEATTSSVEHPVDDSTILKILNGKYRCDINAEDITITYINGSFYTLEAKVDSLGYIGKATLSVGDLIEIPLIPTENALVEAIQSILTSNIKINDRPYSITSPLVYDVENIIFKEFNKADKKFSYFLNLNDVAVTVTDVAFSTDSKPSQANNNETVREKNKDFILSAFIPATVSEPVGAISVPSEFKVNTWLDSLDKLDRIFEVRLNSEVVKLVDLTAEKESPLVATLHDGVVTFTNTKHQPVTLELRALTASLAASEDPSFAFITGDDLAVGSSGYEHYSFDVEMLAIPLVNLEVSHVVPPAPIYQALLERVGESVGDASVVTVNESNQVVKIHAINSKHDNYQSYNNSIEIAGNSKVATVNIASNGFSFLDVFAIPVEQWAKIQDQGLGFNAFTVERTVNGVTTLENLTVNNLIARGIVFEPTENSGDAALFMFAYTHKGDYEATTIVKYSGELFLDTEIELTTRRDLTARYIPSLSIVDQDRLDALKAIDGEWFEKVAATVGDNAFTGNAGYVSHTDADNQFVINYQKVPSVEEIEEAKLSANFLVEVKIDSAVKVMLDEAILNYKPEDKDKPLLIIKPTGNIELEGVSVITYEAYKLQAFQGLVHSADTNSYSLVVRVKTNIALNPDFNLENPVDEVDRIDAVGSLTVDFDADTLYGNVFVNGESAVVYEVKNSIAFESPKLPSPVITVAADQAGLFASAPVQARIQTVAPSDLTVNGPSDHLIVDQTDTLLGVNVKRLPEAKVFWAIMAIDLTEEQAANLSSLTVTRNGEVINAAVFQDSLIVVDGKHYFLERFAIENSTENALIYETDFDGAELVYVPQASNIVVNVSVIEPPSTVFIQVDEYADDDSQIALLSHEITDGYTPITVEEASPFDAFKAPLMPIMGLTFEELAIKRVKGNVINIDERTLVGVEFKLYITKEDLDLREDSDEVVARITKRDTDWSMDITRQLFKRQTYVKNGDLYLFLLFKVGEEGGYNGEYNIEVDWDGITSNDEYVISGFDHNSFYRQELPFTLNLDATYLPRDLESPLLFWPTDEIQKDLYRRLLAGEILVESLQLPFVPLDYIKTTTVDNKLQIEAVRPIVDSRQLFVFAETDLTDDAYNELSNGSIRVETAGVWADVDLRHASLVKVDGIYYHMREVALVDATDVTTWEVDLDAGGKKFKVSTSVLEYQTTFQDQFVSPTWKWANNPSTIIKALQDNAISQVRGIDLSTALPTTSIQDQYVGDTVTAKMVRTAGKNAIFFLEAELPVRPDLAAGTIVIADSAVTPIDFNTDCFEVNGKFYLPIVARETLTTGDSVVEFTLYNGNPIALPSTSVNKFVFEWVNQLDSPIATYATNQQELIDAVIAGTINPTGITVENVIPSDRLVLDVFSVSYGARIVKSDEEVLKDLLAFARINLTEEQFANANPNGTVQITRDGVVSSMTIHEFMSTLIQHNDQYLMTMVLNLEDAVGGKESITEIVIDFDGVGDFYASTPSTLTTTVTLLGQSDSPTFSVATNQAELLAAIHSGEIDLANMAIVDPVVGSNEVREISVTADSAHLTAVVKQNEQVAVPVFIQFNITEGQFAQLANLEGTISFNTINGQQIEMTLAEFAEKLVQYNGKFYHVDSAVVSNITVSPPILMRAAIAADISATLVYNLDWDGGGVNYTVSTSTLQIGIDRADPVPSFGASYLYDQHGALTALRNGELSGSRVTELAALNHADPDYTYIEDQNNTAMNIQFIQVTPTPMVYILWIALGIDAEALNSVSPNAVITVGGVEHSLVEFREQLVVYGTTVLYPLVVELNEEVISRDIRITVDEDGVGSKWYSESVSDLTHYLVTKQPVASPVVTVALNQAELHKAMFDGVIPNVDPRDASLTPPANVAYTELTEQTLRRDLIQQTSPWLTRLPTFYKVDLTPEQEFAFSSGAAAITLAYPDGTIYNGFSGSSLQQFTIRHNDEVYFVEYFDVSSDNNVQGMQFLMELDLDASNGLFTKSQNSITLSFNKVSAKGSPVIAFSALQSQIVDAIIDGRIRVGYELPEFYNSDHMALQYGSSTRLQMEVARKAGAPAEAVLLRCYEVQMGDELLAHLSTNDTTVTAVIQGVSRTWTAEQFKTLLFYFEGMYRFVLPTERISIDSPEVNDTEIWTIDLDGGKGFFDPDTRHLEFNYYVTDNNVSPKVRFTQEQSALHEMVANGEVVLPSLEEGVQIVSPTQVAYNSIEENRIDIEITKVGDANAVLPIFEEVTLTEEQFNALHGDGLTIAVGSEVAMQYSLTKLKEGLVNVNGVYYKINFVLVGPNQSGVEAYQETISIDLDGTNGNKYWPTVSVLTREVRYVEQLSSPSITFMENQLEMLELFLAGQLTGGVAPEGYVSSDDVAYTYVDGTRVDISVNISDDAVNTLIPRFALVSAAKSDIDEWISNPNARFFAIQNVDGNDEDVSSYFADTLLTYQDQYVALLPVNYIRESADAAGANVVFTIDVDGTVINTYRQTVSTLTSNVNATIIFTGSLLRWSSHHNLLVPLIKDGTIVVNGIDPEKVSLDAVIDVSEDQYSISTSLIGATADDLVIGVREFLGTEEQWMSIDGATIRRSIVPGDSIWDITPQDFKFGTFVYQGTRYIAEAFAYSGEAEKSYTVTYNISSLKNTFSETLIESVSTLNVTNEWVEAKPTKPLLQSTDQALIHELIMNGDVVLDDVDLNDIIPFANVTYNAVASDNLDLSIIKEAGKLQYLPQVLAVDYTAEELAFEGLLSVFNGDNEADISYTDLVDKSVVYSDQRYLINLIPIDDYSASANVTTVVDFDGDVREYTTATTTINIIGQVMLKQVTPNITIAPNQLEIIQAMKDGTIPYPGVLLQDLSSVTYDEITDNSIKVTVIRPVEENASETLPIIMKLSATPAQFSTMTNSGTITMYVDDEPHVMPFSDIAPMLFQHGEAYYMIAGPTTLTENEITTRNLLVLDADGEGLLYDPVTSDTTISTTVIKQIASPKFTVAPDLKNVVNAVKTGALDIGIDPAEIIDYRYYVVPEFTATGIHVSITVNDPLTTTGLVVLGVDISDANYAKLTARTKLTVRVGETDEVLAHTAITSFGGKYYLILPVTNETEQKYRNSIVTIDVDGPGSKFLETGSTVAIDYNIEFVEILPLFKVSAANQEIYTALKTGDLGTELQQRFASSIPVEWFSFTPAVEGVSYPAFNNKHHRGYTYAPVAMEFMGTEEQWLAYVEDDLMSVYKDGAFHAFGSYGGTANFDYNGKHHIFISNQSATWNGRMTVAVVSTNQGVEYTREDTIDSTWVALLESPTFKVYPDQLELLTILRGIQEGTTGGSLGANLQNIIVPADADLSYTPDIASNALTLIGYDHAPEKFAPMFFRLDRGTHSLEDVIAKVKVAHSGVDGLEDLNWEQHVLANSMIREGHLYYVANMADPRGDTTNALWLDVDGSELVYGYTESRMVYKYDIGHRPIAVAWANNQAELVEAVRSGALTFPIGNSDIISLDTVTYTRISANALEMIINSPYDLDVEDRQNLPTFYQIKFTEEEYNSFLEGRSTMSIIRNGGNFTFTPENFAKNVKLYNGQYIYAEQTDRQNTKRATTIQLSTDYNDESGATVTSRNLQYTANWNVHAKSQFFFMDTNQKDILTKILNGEIVVPNLDVSTLAMSSNVEYTYENNVVTVTQSGDPTKKVPLFVYSHYNPELMSAIRAWAKLTLTTNGVDESLNYSEFLGNKFTYNGYEYYIAVDDLEVGTGTYALTSDVDGVDPYYLPITSTFNAVRNVNHQMVVQFAEDQMGLQAAYEDGSFPLFAPEYVVLPASHYTVRDNVYTWMDVAANYLPNYTRAVTIYVEVMFPPGAFEALGDDSQVRLKFTDLTGGEYYVYTGTAFKETLYPYNGRYYLPVQTRTEAEVVFELGFDFNGTGTFDSHALTANVGFYGLPKSPALVMSPNASELLAASKNENLLTPLFVDSSTIADPSKVYIEISDDGLGGRVEVEDELDKTIPLFATFTDDSVFDRLNTHSKITLSYTTEGENSSTVTHQLNQSSLTSALVTYNGKRHILLNNGNYTGVTNKMTFMFDIDGDANSNPNGDLYSEATSDISIGFERTINTPPFVATYQIADETIASTLMASLQAGEITSTLVNAEHLTDASVSYENNSETGGLLTANGHGAVGEQHAIFFMGTNITDFVLSTMDQIGRLTISYLGGEQLNISKGQLPSALIKHNDVYYVPLTISKATPSRSGAMLFSVYSGDINAVNTWFSVEGTYVAATPPVNVNFQLEQDWTNIWTSTAVGSVDVGSFSQDIVSYGDLTQYDVTRYNGTATATVDTGSTKNVIPVFIETGLVSGDLVNLPANFLLDVYTQGGADLERSISAGTIANELVEYEGKYYLIHPMRPESSSLDMIINFIPDMDNPDANVVSSGITFEATYHYRPGVVPPVDGGDGDGEPEPQPQPQPQPGGGNGDNPVDGG